VLDWAVTRICQHLSSRIQELKQGEIQQVGTAVREHTAKNVAAGALEQELLLWAKTQKLSDDTHSGCASTRCPEDDDYALWPTGNPVVMDGDAGDYGANEADPLSCRFADCQLPTTVVKTMPNQWAEPATINFSLADHLGKTLSSLAKGGAKGSGRHHTEQMPVAKKLDGYSHTMPPGLVHNPFQGIQSCLDSEPWKVAAPSCAPVQPHTGLPLSKFC